MAPAVPLLKQPPVVVTSESDELAALRAAVEAPVRPEDLRQGLEAFIRVAMNGKFEAPKGYRLMREETPLTLGLLAVLQHFTARGWHGDNVTAMGMRVRCLIETLTDMDWIAVNLFKVTDDHESFEFDLRLLQAGAAATMRYDPDTQAFLLEREQFKDRLLYLLTHNL